jgi:hypothetical protein
MRLQCLFFGHEDRVAKRKDRLFLRCACCGRETPGWHVGQASRSVDASEHQPASATIAAAATRWPAPAVRPVR